MGTNRRSVATRVGIALSAVGLFIATLAFPAFAAGPSTVRTSRQIPESAELAAITPDGAREVMVGRGGGQGVWLIDRTVNDTAYHITTSNDMNPAISADGHTIAYVQYGSTRQVFVRDVTNPGSPGAAVLVSSTGTGSNVVAGNGLSDFPSLNANGTLVAFQSTATNLSDTPLPSSGGPNKVYIHDIAAGTNEMVSVDNSGAAQPGNAIKPSVSDDGNIVAFASDGDLGGPPSGAAEEPTTTFNQVWVRNRSAHTTVPASVNNDGLLGDAGSALIYGPTISADGNRVAFESDATNLVPADTNARTDAFVHDMTSGDTTRVSERTPFDQFGVFHPITPYRLLDTRTTTVLGPGQSVDIQVTGVAGVPGDAAGAAVNLTATEPTAASYLTLYPTGEPRPVASNLNFVPGQTRANAASVKIGAGGKITVYNNAGNTQVVVDLDGWYDAASANGGGGFVSTQPTRLLDTRTAGIPLGPGQQIDLQVAGVAGVPTGATAVAFNMTATEPTANSYLTAFPAGEARPLASNLNVVPGETNPNTVVVKVGADGKVSIYNNAGNTHVIVDLAGWFEPIPGLAGGGFTALTPARLLDTRTGGTKVGPGQTIDLAVAGAGGVPAMGVTTVALNVTVTEPTTSSYVTAFPTGVARPLASNLNFVAGQTVPNEVLVQVGANGKVSFYNNAGSTHLVVDVIGYFTGTQVSEGGSGPAVSADGQHVAFESLSSTLTAGDVNGVVDAFVRDLAAPLTERVSVVDETTGGTEATGTRIDGRTGEVVPQKNGADVTISADGNLVSFASNGNLSNDRPAGEEPGTVSTESAVFTRTRS